MRGVTAWSAVIREGRVGLARHRARAGTGGVALFALHFDHVVELRSIRAARIGGTLSLIGVLAGGKAEVALPLVVIRNLRLQGVTVGSRDDFAAMVPTIAQHLSGRVLTVFALARRRLPPAFRPEPLILMAYASTNAADVVKCRQREVVNAC